MSIRFATNNDIPIVKDIYAHAKARMHANGNATQWVNGYPECGIVNDIEQQVLYVGEDAQGIYMVFALILGQEPTYQTIDGSWDNEEPYATIHRIASNGSHSHCLKEVLRFAFTKTSVVRIDTHEDNLPMRYALQENGFHYCGVIHLTDGSPRNAYLLTEDAFDKLKQLP